MTESSERPTNVRSDDAANSALNSSMREVIDFRKGSEGALVYLRSLFTVFCEYFDRKLSWSKMRGGYWTEAMLQFFQEQAQKEKARPQREYMTLDQVWWGQFTEIILAFEHESSHRHINKLLDEEVSHLFDIRARSKVGIFYPAVGDEDILVKNIRERLRSRALRGSKIPGEEYLFMLGFPTRRQGKAAIKFKAYFFRDTGELVATDERVILQADGK